MLNGSDLRISRRGRISSSWFKSCFPPLIVAQCQVTWIVFQLYSWRENAFKICLRLRGTWGHPRFQWDSCSCRSILCVRGFILCCSLPFPIKNYVRFIFSPIYLTRKSSAICISHDVCVAHLWSSKFIYPSESSPDFNGVDKSFVFGVVWCWPLYFCIIFFWSLPCLSYIELRLLITTLAFSNFLLNSKSWIDLNY